MENNQKPELEQPMPKLSDRIDTNVKVVIAFFLGAILAGTLVQFALPILAAHASELMIGFIAVIGLLAIIALIFTIFKEFFFKLFFGISKADLEDVKTSAESMAGNAVKQDWVAASKDFKVVSQKGSAWYAWLSYRRWVVTVFYTLFLAFAGLLGSVLLYNQNQLLEKQNEKIDDQTKLFEKQNDKIDSQIQLEESSRRGNLIVMMSNIMDKIDEEIRSAQEKGDSSRSLSPQLIGRIGALSYAFRPYRFWQDSMLIEKPLSPERGQLLLALVNSDFDTLTYNNICQEATFEQAYLENANLEGAHLKEINLKGANLKGVNLDDAILIRANLDDVDLNRANLNRAILKGAILNYANLDDANLFDANLIDTYLVNASLVSINNPRINLSSIIPPKAMRINTKTNLKGANLKGADLSEAHLIGADLSKAELDETNFSKAKLSEADLSEANLVRSNLSEANLIIANLNEADLSYTNLIGADLSRANLSNANLVGADLRKIKLNEANLLGTIIQQKEWLTKLREWKVEGYKPILEKYRTVSIPKKDVLGNSFYRIKLKN